MVQKYPNTGEWKEAFLAALRALPNVSKAAKKVGISRSLAYKARKEDEEFAVDWDNAWDESLDGLEAEMFRRAKKSSDTLLIFTLKSHRPDVYRETVRNEITGSDGANLVIEVVYADAKADADAT